MGEAEVGEGARPAGLCADYSRRRRWQGRWFVFTHMSGPEVDDLGVLQLLVVEDHLPLAAELLGRGLLLVAVLVDRHARLLGERDAHLGSRAGSQTAVM